MNLRVYKRGKYYWYYFCINGKTFRSTTHTQSKDLALLYAQKIYHETYCGISGIKSLDVLVSDFIELHLRHKEKNLDERYAKAKRKILIRFLDYLKGKDIQCLQDIVLAILEEYKSHLLAIRKPKTVKNIITTIATMLNHAVKLDYLERNPCVKLDPIRGITKNKKRFLSIEEIEKVREITKGTTLEMLTLTALYTGMRRAELINLKYEDIDLEKRLVYVKHRDGFTTKSKKERVIPLHANLANIYQRHTKKDGFCFPISIHWATEYFTDLTDKHGLEGVGLHTLRHTFASHLAMAGVPLFHIAQWLGHSTTYVTELYSHLCLKNPGRAEIEKLKFD